MLRYAHTRFPMSPRFHAFLAPLTLALAACVGGCDGSKKDEPNIHEDAEVDEDEPAADDEPEPESKPSPETPETIWAFGSYPEGESPMAWSDVSVKAKSSLLTDTGGKYLALSYKAKLLQALETGETITVKASCVVDGRVFVDAMMAFAEFDKMRPGEAKQIETALYMGRSLASEPSLCQFSGLISKFMTGDRPKVFGHACWSDGEISDGPCPSLPLEDADAGLEIVDASANFEEVAFGERRGKTDLRFQYTVRSGSPLPKDHAIFVNAACVVGEDTLVEENPALANLQYLQPGESMKLAGSAYPMKGVDQEPSQCELTFQLKTIFDEGGDVFGTYCFKSGTLNEGSCG